MMDGPDRRQTARPPDVTGGSETRARRVVTIGLSPEALSVLPRNILDPKAHIVQSSYEGLDMVVLSGPNAPDLVLTPLLTPVFDALDLARYLSQAGYRGRYLALVDALPSAKLIRAEVEAQSPDLNFDLIVLDGTTPLHSL
ncbi:MAG: hypothetical protein NXH79_09180 [Rhodobacteraceae bacterium]|jgi:CheY-like chemotaxis protein|nr:hypothetical protein [Paracoccaceae bacterium]